MMNLLLASYLLFLSPAHAAPLSLEEFRLSYGSKSFFGRSCSIEKCRFPQLYQAHHARVELSPGGELALHLEKGGKAIFPAIRVPAGAFHYYLQESVAPHEGFELESPNGPRKLLRTEKGENGFRYDFFEQEMFGLRLVKFKQRKEDTRWDYGVELIYGTQLIRVFVSPDGQALEESLVGGDKEVENQYLVGRAPAKPAL